MEVKKKAPRAIKLYHECYITTFQNLFHLKLVVWCISSWTSTTLLWSSIVVVSVVIISVVIAGIVVAEASLLLLSSLSKLTPVVVPGSLPLLTPLPLPSDNAHDDTNNNERQEEFHDDVDEEDKGDVKVSGLWQYSDPVILEI